ncbi:hypothetical protein PAMA_013957 [Pampus argenteus]
MDIAETRGAPKCVGKMEKEVAPQKRQYCRATALNVISPLCSVASIAFCVLLSINATDIKNRVVDLESGNGEHTFIRAPGYSTDDLNSLIQQRVNELLSQARDKQSKLGTPEGLPTCSASSILIACGFVPQASEP